jgi:stearoyl-CoA desaturase (delta-9 desaturase)
VDLTWNGRRFDWVNVAYFGVVHAIALTAPFYFSWTAAGVALFFWWLTGSIGICLTYHRLLTHRGFTVPKPLEYLLTLVGMLASEGGATLWVARHRYHHVFSDRAQKDIHTPKDGFWWSHWGWILCKVDLEDREVERRHAPEMVADPVHRVLNRIHIVPNILVGLALYAWAGWGMVVWGVFLRMVINLHATWFVNSAAHTFGYRTFDTPEGSTNCWWVGLIAWGEGWHNNHHAFQRSARHGHAWWELDMTWMAIRMLALLGLARDIQLLPATADKFRLDKRIPGEIPAPVAESVA